MAIEGIFIRITVDLDRNSRFTLWWACLKGRLLIGRMPDRIYKTRKGFHCIWEGLPITEETSMWWRKLIGDDSHRIALDSQGKRIKQVLFDTKTIKYFDPAKSFDEDKTLLREETFIRRRIK